MRTQIEIEYLDKLGGWLSIMEKEPLPSEATKDMLKEAKAWCGPNIDEKSRREELIKIFEEYAAAYNEVNVRSFALDEEVERIDYLYNILSKVYNEFRAHKSMLNEICLKKATFPDEILLL